MCELLTKFRFDIKIQLQRKSLCGEWEIARKEHELTVIAIVWTKDIFVKSGSFFFKITARSNATRNPGNRGEV